MIYRKITINCVKDNLLREKVTQQEHGAVNFAFTVMNGRELIDLTECQQAVYYGTKPDGHVIGNVCTVENDKVIMPLTLQMTTCEGLLEGIIELQYNDGNIRFYGVNFEVYPAPEMAYIESKDEFTLLETAIAQAKNAYQIAVENGFEGTEEDWLESLKGQDYVLTENDKHEIAQTAIADIVDGDEVKY